MTDYMDFLFDRFRWYRRWQGGTWYQVRSIPFFQGGFVTWNRELPSCTHEVLNTEDYGK